MGCFYYSEIFYDAQCKITMLTTALLVGIISAAAIAFGIVGLNQYSKLQAADPKASVEKSYIWWGSIILIIIGLLALVTFIYMLWASGMFVGSTKPTTMVAQPPAVTQTMPTSVPVNQGSLLSPSSPRSLSTPSRLSTAPL